MLLQPRIDRAGIDWLNRIMLAHRRDTWAEAAEIVLAAIAADPADPVNAWAFTAADVPAAPRWLAAGGRRGPRGFRADTSILVRLDPDLARELARRVLLGLTASKAVAAVLAVARRLDADGRGYMPEARP